VTGKARQASQALGEALDAINGWERASRWVNAEAESDPGFALLQPEIDAEFMSRLKATVGQEER
jgi:hypothetical protein